MPTTSAAALVKIDDFNKRSGGTDWLNITKTDLVTGLKDRVATPNNINTSVVNLCGPGAFFRFLAMDDPVMYVQAVTDLWERNEASIGTRKFKASHGLRIAPLVKGISAVDWVPLASLRDDENTLISYNSASGGASGITLPSALEKWFKQAGYAEVKNETNVLFTKDLANFKEADRLRGLGRRVALFINADMLNSATQNKKSIIPNHWVCANSLAWIDEEKDTFSTKVHSWGKIMPVPPLGTMPIGDFVQNYYGYVSAKPA